MYQRKLERDIRCPLEYGMELFGGKWNSHIVCVLAVLGTLRYSEPRREMGNITGLPDFFTNKAGVLLEGGRRSRVYPAEPGHAPQHHRNGPCPHGKGGPGSADCMTVPVFSITAAGWPNRAGLLAVSARICHNYPKIRSMLRGCALRIRIKSP